MHIACCDKLIPSEDLQAAVTSHAGGGGTMMHLVDSSQLAC